MKNKRIGTISMAIILISFGVLMFISQISQISAVEIAIKFWPSILILLGIEILWFNYKGKDDEGNTKIRYDIFSIFIVMVILGVNLGIYGVLELGVMDSIKSEISSKNYRFELPAEEYTIDDTVEKIVISGYSNIRVEEGDMIRSTAFMDIRADSEDNAKNILEEEHAYVKIEKIENTVYVKYSPNWNNRTYVNDLNLIIPADIQVEVSDADNLNIVGDKIKSNWVIDNISRVKLRLNKDSNMRVLTNLEDEDQLEGNVQWKNGELLYGEGKFLFNILNAWEVTVDEI